MRLSQPHDLLKPGLFKQFLSRICIEIDGNHPLYMPDAAIASLFEPQRLDRVETCGLAGWIEAEEDANGGAKEEGDNNRTQ